MRPSATQIIKGIKWSFENHIAPKLEDKQAQSMARSILGLLDHLHVRVEDEGRLLAEDNADKKELFHGLVNLLGPESVSTPGLAEVIVSMEQALTKEYRAADAYPTVASLTEESEELKRALVIAIEVLQSKQETLPTDTYAQADKAIRDQLTRQLDRQDTLVLPFGKNRVY